MENSLLAILAMRVAALPKGLGTSEQLKRYLLLKRGCIKRMHGHETGHHDASKLEGLMEKHCKIMAALELLVEYMDANGAPDTKAAIIARMHEIDCPETEIEGYLLAFENELVLKSLASNRKPPVTWFSRLMAFTMRRQRRTETPELSQAPA